MMIELDFRENFKILFENIDETEKLHESEQLSGLLLL